MKKELAREGEKSSLAIVTGKNKPGKRRKVPHKVMNAKQYRARVVAQERALSPRIFRQYVRKIVTPCSWALLAEIHAEIAPRIPAEILPDVVAPVIRFASRRGTDQGQAQAESRFALCGGEYEYGIGIYDHDQVAGGEERELSPILPVEPIEKLGTNQKLFDGGKEIL